MAISDEIWTLIESCCIIFPWQEGLRIMRLLQEEEGTERADLLGGARGGI